MVGQCTASQNSVSLHLTPFSCVPVMPVVKTEVRRLVKKVATNLLGSNSSVEGLLLSKLDVICVEMSLLQLSPEQQQNLKPSRSGFKFESRPSLGSFTVITHFDSLQSSEFSQQPWKTKSDLRPKAKIKSIKWGAAWGWRSWNFQLGRVAEMIFKGGQLKEGTDGILKLLTFPLPPQKSPNYNFSLKSD